MESLILYALCTAAMFYLGSRALITRWLWSRYPPLLAIFMDCSACSGAWYGALVAYIGGFHLGLSFLGLPGASWVTVAAAGLGSMTWTPIIAGLVQWSLDALGHAVPIDDLAEIEPGSFVSATPITPIRERRVEVLPAVFASHPEAEREMLEQLKKERDGSGPR